MNKYVKIGILSALALVLAGLGALHYLDQKYYLSSKDSSNLISDAVDEQGKVAGVNSETSIDPTEQLASDLSSKGVVLYCAYWSDDCTKQKAMFGKYADKIDSVECDEAGEDANPDECLSREISQYPTWVYGTQKYSGIQSLSDLAEIVKAAN